MEGGGGLTNTAVTLHLEARWTDAAERALKVLASAWQAGSREAETLIGVCGEEEEGSQHQPMTGDREQLLRSLHDGQGPQNKFWIQGKG